MHFQIPPFDHVKVVYVSYGKIIDVVVDIRRGSPTFGRHVSVELSGENHLQVFVSRGLAHGFSVLSETAVFQYKCDEFYHPEAESGIQLLDDTLGIDWQIPAEKMIMSGKDRVRARLADTPLVFEYGKC